MKKIDTLEDAMRMISEESLEWVEENIHPHVPRDEKDSDSSYFRKMALFLLTQNIEK